jgi:hypothetical protein
MACSSSLTSLSSLKPLLCLAMLAALALPFWSRLRLPGLVLILGGRQEFPATSGSFAVARSSNVQDLTREIRYAWDLVFHLLGDSVDASLVVVVGDVDQERRSLESITFLKFFNDSARKSQLVALRRSRCLSIILRSLVSSGLSLTLLLRLHWLGRKPAWRYVHVTLQLIGHLAMIDACNRRMQPFFW